MHVKVCKGVCLYLPSPNCDTICYWMNGLKEISICFPHQAKINNYPFQLCLTHKHTVRHKRTIISIHYSEAAVFSIREMNPPQMICINTCQCFVSHWYLMNFKHWLFFSGNFPCSHKMSSPDRVEVLSHCLLQVLFWQVGSGALALLFVWFHLTQNIYGYISFSRTCVWTSDMFESTTLSSCTIYRWRMHRRVK